MKREREAASGGKTRLVTGFKNTGMGAIVSLRKWVRGRRSFTLLLSGTDSQKVARRWKLKRGGILLGR